MAVNDQFKLRVQFTNELTTTTAEVDIAFNQGSILVLDTPGEDLIQSFQSNAQAAILSCISERWHLVRYAVHELPSGLLVEEQLGVTEIGDLTGDMMPVNICGLITHRTGLLGRSGRGRTYLPCPNEVANSNGAPSTAYLSLMEDFISGLVAMEIGGISFADWQYGVWSTVLQAFNTATDSTPRQHWGSQRLRTR
jgi:hypothetical protein